VLTFDNLISLILLTWNVKGGGREVLRWCGFALFLVRFCGNLYFNLRYCGLIRLSGLRFHKFSVVVIGKKESAAVCVYSDPDASDDFWSLVYVLQGTIVVQASFAVCNFRFFQLIIGTSNHFIQWCVDLLTFRAGNLSLGFPTVFAVASCGTMSAEQEEVVMRMVGKRWCYLKERLEDQQRFFWEEELASGELYASTIVCFTEHFMGLTTLSSGHSKLFLEIFKWNLRLIQSNCDIKWKFRARIRDIWAWKLASWRIFTKQ